MSNLLKFKWLLLSFILVSFLSACDKDLNEDSGSKVEVLNLTNNDDENNDEPEGGEEEEPEEEYEESECFEFVFPIEIVFPDSSTLLVDSDSTLYEVLDEWYDMNPESEDDPSFVFPIEVVLDDGTLESIIDEDAFDELIEFCEENYGHDECEEEENEEGDEEEGEEEEEEEDEEEDDEEEDDEEEDDEEEENGGN